MGKVRIYKSVYYRRLMLLMGVMAGMLFPAVVVSGWLLLLWVAVLVVWYIFGPGSVETRANRIREARKRRQGMEMYSLMEREYPSEFGKPVAPADDDEEEEVEEDYDNMTREELQAMVRADEEREAEEECSFEYCMQQVEKEFEHSFKIFDVPYYRRHFDWQTGTSYKIVPSCIEEWEPPYKDCMGDIVIHDDPSHQSDNEMYLSELL